MAELTIQNLVKGYGDTPIIKGIDLSIEQGEFVVFVGPSGCGKSTLLRLIAGLEDADDGTISIGDTVVNDVQPADRGIAMVFQSYALYPHMTVAENMAFGLKMAKADKATIAARVAKAADMLQLGPLLERLPKQLSGGQRQRVAIGRAITRDPRIFLFDEPLSNLDAALRVATRIEIARLKEGMPDTTMIYVTHDQVEAMTLADRIVVLNGGKVEQVGTPLDLYHRPANIFVAQFIGSPAMNIVDAHLLPNPPVGAAKAGIRPEHLSMVSVGTGDFSGIASITEYLGETTQVYMQAGYSEIIVTLNGDAEVKRGEKICLLARPDRTHFFDADGVAIR
jgi:ABC-type sugar transport system ATPase subunit